MNRSAQLGYFEPECNSYPVCDEQLNNGRLWLIGGQSTTDPSHPVSLLDYWSFTPCVRASRLCFTALRGSMSLLPTPTSCAESEVHGQHVLRLQFQQRHAVSTQHSVLRVPVSDSVTQSDSNTHWHAFHHRDTDTISHTVTRCALWLPHQPRGGGCCVFRRWCPHPGRRVLLWRAVLPSHHPPQDRCALRAAPCSFVVLLLDQGPFLYQVAVLFGGVGCL